MNPYKEILRKFFSEYVSALRKRRGLTQEQMAEKLRITGRAYSDLERGIYCFSAICSCVSPLRFLKALTYSEKNFRSVSLYGFMC